MSMYNVYTIFCIYIITVVLFWSNQLIATGHCIVSPVPPPTCNSPKSAAKRSTPHQSAGCARCKAGLGAARALSARGCKESSRESWPYLAEVWDSLKVSESCNPFSWQNDPPAGNWTTHLHGKSKKRTSLIIGWFFMVEFDYMSKSKGDGACWWLK